MVPVPLSYPCDSVVVMDSLQWPSYILAAATIWLFVQGTMASDSNVQQGIFSVPLLRHNESVVINAKQVNTKTSYYGEIGVGKSTNIPVIFDTSVTFIQIPFCSVNSKANCYNDIGATVITISNGKTRKNDTRNEDDIVLGNQRFKNQLFAEKDKKGDGVVGLSIFGQPVDFTTPLFLSGMEQGLFDKNVFSIYYNSADKNGRGSQITFGGWDKKILVKGNFINWCPFNTSGETAGWKITIERLVVKNIAIKARTAIVHTGSAMILGPESDIEQISKVLGNTYKGNLIMVDKKTFDDLKPITFTINGHVHEIHPKNLVVEQTNDEKFILALGKGERGATDWYMGDYFLANYYTIFDVGNRRLGLMSLNSSASLVGSLAWIIISITVSALTPNGSY